eukprot:CAMPEP_0184458294 /NCGR_PEP_ID=MMETSP0740-20130409/32827_1 /TAXON_ID=385413 /ORGANISM="Thalassiosira miniscula, Strain CCMP1093" /LENGTH=57 /DNA_ID=CAMNT_0026830909 /DNA_START=320 /DNA_END=489 /DNA_ORIENTATION=+
MNNTSDASSSLVYHWRIPNLAHALPIPNYPYKLWHCSHISDLSAPSSLFRDSPEPIA